MNTAKNNSSLRKKAALLSKEGKLSQALTIFQALSQSRHSDWTVLQELATVQFRLGKFRECAVNLRWALKEQPRNPSLLTDLGASLAAVGEYVAALDYFKQALNLLERRDPFSRIEAFGSGNAMHPRLLRTIQSNICQCLERLDRLDDAKAAYERLLIKHPLDPALRYNLALLQLRAGEFEQAWEGYELRHSQSSRKTQHAQPILGSSQLWKGPSTKRSALLVEDEQGVGDVLMFCRFLPGIRRYTTRLVFQVRPSLVRLLSTLQGPDDIVSGVDAIQQRDSFDHYLPLASIPLHLGLSVADLPYSENYIELPKIDIQRWKQRLQRSPSVLRVGVVWKGNTTNPLGALRSLPPDSLLPALDLPRVEIYSLQKYAGDTLERVHLRHATVTDLESLTDEFTDLASAIVNLDLIVTVDTAAAHLAGALGVETYLLLPKPSDWRWFLASSSSPWYPRMKLFRQEEPGQWQPALRKLTDSLRNRLEELPT